MSIFGEPLPYEDDTATSLIRRQGYPPENQYDQMPQVYQCPCCSEFNRQLERDRLMQAAREKKDAERRRLLQLDVFDERAKPLPTGENQRKKYRRIPDDPPAQEIPPNVPPPPSTIEGLNRKKAAADEAQETLVVTVHHGKNLDAAPRDDMSVIVRCGAFEGQTAKVPRGKGTLTTWDELFEFPYPNTEEALEVLVINDDLQPPTEDMLLGGTIVPSEALHDGTRGNEESVPVMPEDQMESGFDRNKEGPHGAIVVSWYVRSANDADNDRGLDDDAEEQNLSEALRCNFVVHRVFQYTDNGSVMYPDGVLCVLRDTDDTCSESVFYSAGGATQPSLSPFYGKEGFHYLPEDPSQVMQLRTEKKLGHVLVCVPKNEGAPNDNDNEDDEEEELVVIGAVPIDFERLYHKGNSVLLIESKSKDDAVWGEISLEWHNQPEPSADEGAVGGEADKESLFVTVVKGLNLVRRDGEPIAEAYVSVAASDMEGFTIMQTNKREEDDAHVVTWNQEIRFVDVDKNDRLIEVQAFEDGRPIAVGQHDLGDQDNGTIVIPMYDPYNPEQHMGDIVLSYKSLHARDDGEAGKSRAIAAAADEDSEHAPADEEAEEQPEEESPQQEAGDSEQDENAEEQPEEEEEEPARQNDSASDHPAAAAEEEEEQEEEHPEDAEEEDPLQDQEEQQEKQQEEQQEEPAADEENEEQAESEKQQDGDEERAEEEQEEQEDEEEQQQQGDEANENRDIAEDEEQPEEEEQDDAEEDPQEKHDEEEEHPASDDQEEEKQEDNEVQSEEEKQAADEAREDDQQDQEDAAEEDRNEDDEQAEEEKENEENDEENDEADDTNNTNNADDKDDDDDDADGDNNDTNGNRNDADDNNDNDNDQRDNAGEDDTEERDENNAADGADDTENNERDTADNETEDKTAENADEPANDDEGNGEHNDAGNDDNGDATRNDDEDKPGDHPADGAPGDDHDELDDEEEDAPSAPAAAKPEEKKADKPRKSGDKKGDDGRKGKGYQQPWYPAGNPRSENHVPYDKTQQSRKSKENIRSLESRRNQLEEQSVRRASLSQAGTPSAQ